MNLLLEHLMKKFFELIKKNVTLLFVAIKVHFFIDSKKYVNEEINYFFLDFLFCIDKFYM